ncbi:BCLAF1 and THRAP3 family member 3 [Brienomyrus brachyistius]|uniref:BCLAF1 and THRAP3 family member 3 n=1 Tax=Brienomyrus brachyistius TaxID=42636 RepID=UPI0020B1D7AD|nr:BCLAF1 and THRAP3 family member 3 [Brienomyrus brachyistius]XP_048867318.1 BCLAF1 and THRAP3 family member 3 [Brienomyrus brachyistius]
MSRPRPRSPVHPYRLSASKRRSSGHFEDHHCPDSHAMDFDLHRQAGERGDTWPQGGRWHREDRPRAGSPDQHRMWKRGRSRSPQRRSPHAGSTVRRRGSPLSVLDRGHDEHRQSFGRWPQSPGQRSGSGSRRGTAFNDNFQRYPEERVFSRKRVPSPDTHYDARLNLRDSLSGWDRGSHSSNHQEQQEWVPERGAREHRETAFYHPGRRQRFVEGAHSPDFQHLRERSGREHRDPSSPGRGHVIVEYDHGISDHGPPSQVNRYYRSEHQRHGREERDWSGEEQQERVHLGQKEPRVGPLQDRRSPVRERRSPVRERRSPVRERRSPVRERRSPVRERRSPVRERRSPIRNKATSTQSLPRQQESQAKPMSQDLLNCLTMDSNGDVDLRYVGPSLATKKMLQMPPQSKIKVTGTRPDKGERTPTAACGRDRPQETLTIKVDMGGPAVGNSQSLSSTDRQLSLDLVSVGRQRLDFLPALEQLGTRGENTSHSGTFAQEIITLVHQVKERCFKRPLLTLNQRFSTVQSRQLNEDVEEEQVEEEKPGRASSPRINRRIDMSLSELRAFRNVGPKQRRAPDDPSDLRHDLERRRLERLEEVKVTIPGVGFRQAPGSMQSDTEFSSKAQGNLGGWTAAGQKGNKAGSVSETRLGFTRPGFGPQSKSSRIQNRPGPRWRQTENSAKVTDW